MLESPESKRSPLLSADDYELDRHTIHRVLAHVAPVTSTHPWMFMAVTSTGRGAPRWILCDAPRHAPVTDLTQVCHQLRRLLAHDPQNRPINETAVEWITYFVDHARSAERELMPRRLQRALDQLNHVANAWATTASRSGDEHNATTWRTLANLASNQRATDTPDGSDEVDPYALAQRWIDLIRPRLDARRQRSRRRYQLLSDITPDLIQQPIGADNVRCALADLPLRPPLTDRITAAIVGVPTNEPTIHSS